MPLFMPMPRSQTPGGLFIALACRFCLRSYCGNRAWSPRKAKQEDSDPTLPFRCSITQPQHHPVYASRLRYRRLCKTRFWLFAKLFQAGVSPAGHQCWFSM